MPWTSFVNDFYNLIGNLKLCAFPSLQSRYMYHLIKTTNTEVESNFIRSIINHNVTTYDYWMVNDVCFLGELGSVGVSEFIPCNTLLKSTVNYPIALPRNWFYAIHEYTVKSLLDMTMTSHTDRHHSHIWLNKHTGTHRGRHTDTVVVPRIGNPQDHQGTKSAAKSKVLLYQHAGAWSPFPKARCNDPERVVAFF